MIHEFIQNKECCLKFVKNTLESICLCASVKFSVSSFKCLLCKNIQNGNHVIHFCGADVEFSFTVNTFEREKHLKFLFTLVCALKCIPMTPNSICNQKTLFNQ